MPNVVNKTRPSRTKVLSRAATTLTDRNDIDADPDYQIEHSGQSKVATEDITGNELNRQILDQLHLIRAHLELMTGKQLNLTDTDSCT